MTTTERCYFVPGSLCGSADGSKGKGYRGDEHAVAAAEGATDRAARKQWLSSVEQSKFASPEQARGGRDIDRQGSTRCAQARWLAARDDHLLGVGVCLHACGHYDRRRQLVANDSRPAVPRRSPGAGSARLPPIVEGAANPQPRTRAPLHDPLLPHPQLRPRRVGRLVPHEHIVGEVDASPRMKIEPCAKCFECAGTTRHSPSP